MVFIYASENAHRNKVEKNIFLIEKNQILFQYFFQLNIQNKKMYYNLHVILLWKNLEIELRNYLFQFLL